MGRPGTTTGRVIQAATLLAALLACQEPDPSDELTEVFSSTHYTFHLAAGDDVDTTWQERYFDWVVEALDVNAAGRLDYFKYRNRAHLKRLTGRETNGFAEPGTTRFHTIWPVDNHEVVHTLVILHIGHPPALFNEGVAVAHQTDPRRGILAPRWNGQDLHALARQFQSNSNLPALNSLVRSSDFFELDPEITYPVSGSFVRYLLEQEGLEPFKAYLATATFADSPAQTETRFRAAFGRGPATVWDEWRAWLSTP